MVLGMGYDMICFELYYMIDNRLNYVLRFNIQSSSLPRLASILRKRFERLYALAPRDVESSQSTSEFSVLAQVCRTEASSKLSPASVTKVQSLAKPDKGTVADYDKALTSVEQSVRKALASLEKLYKEEKAEEERKQAHEERLKSLRSKKISSLSAELGKARAIGENEAEAEAAADGLSEASEEDKGNEDEDDHDHDGDELEDKTIPDTIDAKLGLELPTSLGFSSLQDFPLEDAGSVPFVFDIEMDAIAVHEASVLSAFGQEAIAEFAAKFPGNTKSAKIKSRLSDNFAGLQFMGNLLYGAEEINRMYFSSSHVWVGRMCISNRCTRQLNSKY